MPIKELIDAEEENKLDGAQEDRFTGDDVEDQFDEIDDGEAVPDESTCRFVRFQIENQLEMVKGPPFDSRAKLF